MSGYFKFESCHRTVKVDKSAKKKTSSPIPKFFFIIYTRFVSKPHFSVSKQDGAMV